MITNFDLVINELLREDQTKLSTFENKIKLVYAVQCALNNTYLGGSMAMHMQGLTLSVNRLERCDIDLIATSIYKGALDYVQDNLCVKLGFVVHEADESNTADFKIAFKHAPSGLKIEIAQAELGLEFIPEFIRYKDYKLCVNNLPAILLVKKRYAVHEKNFKHSEDLELAKRLFDILDRDLMHASAVYSNRVYAKLYLAKYLGAFEKPL